MIAGANRPLRYFFHVRNGSGFIPDEEGQKAVGEDMVRLIAKEGARSVMAADILEGHLYLDGQIEVTDTSGSPVLILRFRDAIELRAEKVGGA